MLLFFLHDFAPSHSSLLTGGTALVLGTPLDAPIEDVVILVPFTDEKVSEKLAKVRVVGLVVEAKSTGVIQEDAKLVGEAAAKDVGRSGHLLLHDSIVFLLLGRGLQSLPRESASKEVHENVGERFQIIAASLLDTQMSIDRGVASSTGQIFVLSVGDMQVGLGISEFLGETEIDNVDLVASLPDSHQEVIWFDVSVDEVARMDVFDT